MALTEKDIIIARELLDLLEVGEIEYLERKHALYKETYRLPVKPTYLARTRVKDPLDKAMLDEAFREVDWLYPYHKTIISELLLGTRQFIDPNVREHVETLTAVGKVKLCCILIAIAWAEYNQDREGYFKNYWYEHHARMKRQLQAVGEPSSYGAWQNPVPRVDAILEEEFRKHTDNPGASALINALLEEHRNYLKGIQQPGAEPASTDEMRRVYYLLARDEDPHGDPERERRLQFYIEMAIRVAFTCDIDSEDETQVFVRWNHGNKDCTELAAIQMQLNMMRRHAISIQQWSRSENPLSLFLPTLWKYVVRKRHDMFFRIESLLDDIITPQQRAWIADDDLARARRRLEANVKALFEERTLAEIREFPIENDWPVCDIDGSVDPRNPRWIGSQTGRAIAAAQRFFGLFDSLNLAAVKDADTLISHLHEELAAMHVIPRQVNTSAAVATNSKSEEMMREIMSLEDADMRKRRMLEIVSQDNAFMKDLSAEYSRDIEELRAMMTDGRALEDKNLLLRAARRLQTNHMANEKDTEAYTASAKDAYDVIIRRFEMVGPVSRSTRAA